MAHDEDAEAGATARPRGAHPRARITDVAERARVSIKTVSRVVNDEPGVREETRTRVRAAIDDLGFVPNTTARSLKTGGQDAIGVVIDAISDPFFADLVSVLEELAAEHGMSLLFASTGFDADRERGDLQRLAGHQLRGLIIAPVGVSAQELQVLRRRFPIVSVDRVREGIDSVIVDDFGAARDAARHLVEQGHRRIGFIGDDPAYPTNSARLAGFRAALDEAGIPVDESLIVGHPRTRSAMADVSAALLARPDAPTAVLCATSRAAIATMDAIRAAGTQGLALISFGDFELADLFTPAITVVDHVPRPIATAAFQRLLELFDDPASEPQRIVLPTSLIQRGSGELPPRAMGASTLLGAES